MLKKNYESYKYEAITKKILLLYKTSSSDAPSVL